ncbi:hypothetical protein O0V02_14830 [Gordonia amicalis]|uniref:hypothetical protein n=1 Tax=Gordonia amicalis TaxID=89053 RepID=UPI0022A79AC5|nr:hypothetical protein [Gordonia amicalis]MCZ0913673.1 hypothetical protein [Gordonia amicalis]
MSSHRRLFRSVVSSCAIVTAVSVLVAGCSSDSDDDTGTGSATSAGCVNESPSRAAGAAPVPISSAKVTLVDAGEGERRVASPAPDTSSAQSVTLVTTSEVASPGSADAETVETPLTARFSCTDRSEVELELGTVTSPDASLNGQLPAMAGTKAGLTTGPGLAPVALRLAPPEQAGEEARLAVEQSLVTALNTSIALPTEPIAVGARWRTERVISAAATVTQTIDARLSAWDGNRLTIQFSAEETPVNSVFAIPGGSDTLTISRFSSEGGGTVEVDLTRGLAVGGELTYTGARELVGADPSRPLVQKTGLTVTWR